MGFKKKKKTRRRKFIKGIAAKLNAYY
jgi:hypothetical protein